MAKTSTKYRSILIASIIVVVIVLSSIGAVTYLFTYDNVTVSGTAFVSGAFVLAPNLRTIQFTDTQTGTTTSSHFTFASQTINVGNYSVTLKSGHSYNVYITFSFMASYGNETEFIKTFTVNAPAGQKETTKDFMYPNPP
jgi:hypothetical protein